MKCPKCKREIAYTAMRCVCGWTATVSGPTAAAPAAPPVVKKNVALPINLRRQLDALLVKGKRYPKPAPRTVADGTTVGREVTEGHGTVCFCELCFPKRMKRHGTPGVAPATEDQGTEAKDGK